ncbi:MAG: ABC transporter ATP-binding protein [Betaproteobacteria bacterium]|nr:ABC transporter ATP-binding protein [Betaproteobacteria bacterium]
MSTPILNVTDLSKTFGGLKAVDALTFAVEQGETLGLIGPNGSGKTTVLNILTAAFPSDAGRVTFDGNEIAGMPAYRVCRAGIARTFQLVRPLKGMSVADNVLVGRIYGAAAEPIAPARKKVRELLDLVGLGGRAEMPVDALTYIDQKRVELARALAADPKLLLLDEWLAGLNPTELEAGITLVRSLKGRGLAIILVEHVMHAVRSLCDRCIVLTAGRCIAEGSPEAVLTNAEVKRAYLGDDGA